MIYTERNVSIKNDKATIDSPIILFRGDREVEIMFTIVDSKFKFESNKGNVIDKTQAAFGQLAVALPDGTDLFTEIVECKNGVVVFSITGEMIDEVHEVGFYSFHIRLYNDDKSSRITLPPVMEGIEIREPLIIEGDVENTDLVGDATVGYSMVQAVGTNKEVFDEYGNYIPTVWGVGDKITAEKLNKMEEGIGKELSINDVNIRNIQNIKTSAFDADVTTLTLAMGQPYSQRNLITTSYNITEVQVRVKYTTVGVQDLKLYIFNGDGEELFSTIMSIDVSQEDVDNIYGIITINVNNVMVTAGAYIVFHTPDITRFQLLFADNTGTINVHSAQNLANTTGSVKGELAISFTSNILQEMMEYIDNRYAKVDNVPVENIKMEFNSSYMTSGTELRNTMALIYYNERVFTEDIIIKAFKPKINVTNTGDCPVTLYVLSPDQSIRSIHNFNITCHQIGAQDMLIAGLAIDLPAHLLLGMCIGNDNISGMYYTQSAGNTIRQCKIDSMNNQWAASQTITNTSLAYSIDTTKRKSIAGAIDTRLIGKKIIAIGDSMVQGHSISKDSGWLAMIANRNDMSYVNYGINGCFLSSKDANGVIDRYETMDDDADYIIVFAGTNDAANNVTMGEDDSETITEFKGALNMLCTGLLNKYPSKRIMFITPYLRNNNYPDYIEAIETICAKYSIPVFNNAKQGGICWQNQAQVEALTLNDTYHLNLAGMEYASYKYESFIRQL